MSVFFTDENRIALSTRFDSTPRFVEEAIRMRFEDASAEKIIKLFKKLTRTTTHSSRIISWNGQNRILGKGECIFTKKGLAAELAASPASISFWLNVLKAIVPFSTEVSRNRKSGGTILKWLDYDMVFRPFEWFENQKLKKNLALQQAQKQASELQLNSKRTPTELELNSSALEPQGLKEGWRTHTELILNSKRDTNKTYKMDKINNLNTTLSTNTVQKLNPEKSWPLASESLGEKERELIKLFSTSFPKVKITQKQAIDFVSTLHSQNIPIEEVKDLITSTRQDILISSLITSLNGLLYYELRKQEVAEVTKGVRIKLEQFNDLDQPANFETAENQAYQYFLSKLNSVPARKQEIKWSIDQFRDYFETQIQQAKQAFDANQARIKSDQKQENQTKQPTEHVAKTNPGEGPTTGDLVATDDRPPCPGKPEDYEWVENDYDLFGGEWKKIRKFVEPDDMSQKVQKSPSVDSVEKNKEVVDKKQKPLDLDLRTSREIAKRTQTFCWNFKDKDFIGTPTKSLQQEGEPGDLLDESKQRSDLSKNYVSLKKCGKQSVNIRDIKPVDLRESEKQKPQESNSGARLLIFFEGLPGYQCERINLGEKDLPNGLGPNEFGRSNLKLSKKGQSFKNNDKKREEKDHQVVFEEIKNSLGSLEAKFTPNGHDTNVAPNQVANIIGKSRFLGESGFSEDQPSSDFSIKKEDCSRPEGELESTNQQDGTAEACYHDKSAISEFPAQEKSHQEHSLDSSELTSFQKTATNRGSSKGIIAFRRNKGHQDSSKFQSSCPGLGDPKIHCLDDEEGATRSPFSQQFSSVGLNTKPIESPRPKNSLDVIGWSEPKQKPNLTSLIKELSANVTPLHKQNNPMKSAPAKTFANKHRVCRSTFENFGGPR